MSSTSPDERARAGGPRSLEDLAASPDFQRSVLALHQQCQAMVETMGAWVAQAAPQLAAALEGRPPPARTGWDVLRSEIVDALRDPYHRDHSDNIREAAALEIESLRRQLAAEREHARATAAQQRQEAAPREEEQAPDLLAVLEAPPVPAEPEPEPGQLRGVPEGVGAGIEVWCGPQRGWREFGRLVGTRIVIVQQHGRLTGGLTFDLGEA